MQIPVNVFVEAEDDELDLKSLCHGKPPKLSIKCQEGGEEYTSWQKVPERGYEWTRGQYITLSAEEIATAKAARPKVESFKVEKPVDFKKVGTKYVFVGAIGLRPPEKATESQRTNYRAVYEVVKESGLAILCRFAPREKVRHYAVVPDDEGAFIAYEIRNRRPAPYPVPTSPADPKTKVQAKMLVEGMKSEDVTLEAEPDPLFDLIQKKLSEQTLLPGVGETTMIPQ